VNALPSDALRITSGSKAAPLRNGRIGRLVHVEHVGRLGGSFGVLRRVLNVAVVKAYHVLLSCTLLGNAHYARLDGRRRRSRSFCRRVIGTLPSPRQIDTPPHILVNNAGIGGGGSYGRWTDASWNWTIGVNLMSVVWGVEIFGPLIEAHGEGGHIVSTASIAGLIPGSGPAYDVTKYGVVALSEGLRVALTPRGIGVSVLCPGFIRTQIMKSRRNVPQRFGTIEEPPTDAIAEVPRRRERWRCAGVLSAFLTMFRCQSSDRGSRF
jgi:NAD(P)-dependent dehydrogenase (short-subunit alcohol dehydrogenase family)